MQWNRLTITSPTCPLLAGLGEERVGVLRPLVRGPPGPDVVATCDYGGPVVAAVQRERLWATQFHPGEVGRHRPGPACQLRSRGPNALPPRSDLDLYPAIDLRDGRCVRLVEGDFSRETVYSDDPVAVAETFARGRCTMDPRGGPRRSTDRQPLNREVVLAIAAAVGSAGVRVQSGGGVRNLDDAAALLDARRGEGGHRNGGSRGPGFRPSSWPRAGREVSRSVWTIGMGR